MPIAHAPEHAVSEYGAPGSPQAPSSRLPGRDVLQPVPPCPPVLDARRLDVESGLFHVPPRALPCATSSVTVLVLKSAFRETGAD
jgi:hypothetical protein